MHRHRVGILLFPEVEVLDFCGPFEIFSVTRFGEERRQEGPSPFDVALVAQWPGVVMTTGGMRVLPDCSFQDCPPLDILLVPGGAGVRKQLENALLLEWLRSRAAEASLLASVCTGSMLLGFAGLLDGHRATTHWRCLDWMRDSFPSVIVESEKHFITDGDVWTSAGISAGIDMSLKIVERCYGEGIARVTARHMEYPYPETDARRIAI